MPSFVRQPLFSSPFGGGAAGGTGGGGGWLQLGMSAASAYSESGFAGWRRILGTTRHRHQRHSIPILASNDEFMTCAAAVRSPAHPRF
ncbi:hypothetical protein P4050_30545 [Pseudomonas aeruginosa]|nr:hypothetical protein [Pseudomonas aeruginosa]